jgi:predicted RNase H-like HicB family nuclease
MKEHKDYTIVFEQDKSGKYIASVVELPGCRVYGLSMEEVKEKIQEAIAKSLGLDRKDANIKLEPFDDKNNY